MCIYAGKSYAHKMYLVSVCSSVEQLDLQARKSCGLGLIQKEKDNIAVLIESLGQSKIVYRVGRQVEEKVL